MESLRHDVIFEDGSAAASIRISFELKLFCGLMAIIVLVLMIHYFSLQGHVEGIWILAQ